MGQLRVAKDEWDKLDDRVKEARKMRFNDVFLNDPALDETTNEYLWDDPRLTEDHTFVLEECRKDKPTKSEKADKVLERISQRVEGRKGSREPVRVTEEMVNQPLELRPNSSVSSPSDTTSSDLEAIKEVDK